MDPDLKVMIGKTMTSYRKTADELIFTDEAGNEYKFHHDQDCCESVTIEDITGDLDDLLGSPIWSAEESVSDAIQEDPYESGTWTFYTFRSHKGTVQVRWLGTSNGYYSESVDFVATGPHFVAGYEPPVKEGNLFDELLTDEDEIN